MRALVLTPSNRQVLLLDVPKPVPGPGEVLVQVHAVALNPVDELYVSAPIAEQSQRIIGTDFAGIVAGASSDLGHSNDARAKLGARVAGFLQGACSTNDRPGAFAEYVAIAYDLIWAVPEAMSLEAASTVSMCGLTAAQGLFSRLRMPYAFTSPLTVQDEAASGPMNVLIYGASTSLGLYSAQLAHHSATASGRKLYLIGVARSSHHKILRDAPYSYDLLLDYANVDWPSQAKHATQGRGIDYAVDCISEGSTVYKTESTLNPEGRLAVFRGPAGGQYDLSGLRIKPIYGAVWEGLGVEIGYNGSIIPASLAARQFATEFYKFLSSGQLEPNPVRLMPGGLDRLPLDGLLLFGKSKNTAESRHEPYMRPISGEKLVYKIL